VGSKPISGPVSDFGHGSDLVAVALSKHTDCYFAREAAIMTCKLPCVFAVVGLVSTTAFVVFLFDVPPLERNSTSIPAVTSRPRGEQGPDPALPPFEKIFNLANLQVPREKILRGRQPKDGISPLDDPATSRVSDASFLRPEGRVVGVTVNGVSRAYPINVLNWHEAINDRLGNTDLLITYCSLCDSVTVCDRRLDGQTYRFGVAGLIYESNMVLYDRADQALWSQLTSSAMSGPHAGRSLRHVGGWEMTTFGVWRESHPGSTVVNFATGYDRDYASDPHRDYFATDRLDARFQDVTIDSRLRTKARIIGVSYGGQARAYPVDVLQASGSTTVIDRIDQEPVEFAIDAKTRTVSITRVPAASIVTHSFWFAWAARFPRTEVYQRPDEGSKTHRSAA
jgi:hypothetical protein